MRFVKGICTLLFFISLGLTQTQRTFIPDSNFEQALIDLGYDDVLDDSVKTDNIKNVTYLDVSSKSITDLTGINGFTSLTTLHSYDNQLTSLDLSNNLLLRELRSNRNKITTIDVAVNDSLVVFAVARNELTSVTGIDDKPILEELHIHNRQHDPEPRNKVDSLDASGSPLLDVIFAEYNNLSFIDVTGSKSIETIDVNGNQLTNIDLSTVDSLKHLYAEKNLLTELDLSNNTNLRLLDLDRNKLTSLDLSKNTLLTKLHLSDNNLTSLDLSNNLLLRELWSIRNAITSIDMAANDSLVFFSLGSNSLTKVTGVNNKPIMEEFYIHNVPHYGEVANNKVDTLDVSGSPLLDKIRAEHNNLSFIDVTGSKLITDIIVDDNQLTNIDLSTVDSLKWLQARKNPLTKLDLSKNTNLLGLYLENNDKLDSLDVSNNKKLYVLTVLHSDELKYLNMKNGMMEMTVFDARFTPKLTCIETLDPNTATAKWTNANNNIDLGDSFAINCGSIEYPDNGDFVLSFDGNNDYVDIPDMVAPSGNAPRTFMAWIKRDDASTSWPGKAIGGWGNDKNNELMNIMVLDGVLNWHLHGQNTLTGSAQIRPDTWYHIAATYDSTTQRFYVDGLLDGSNDRILNTGSGNVKIGRQPDYNGAYFSGNIDEVTIFDRALTQEEIQNSISNGLPENNAGLLGHWKFNAGTDTIAYDHSANANHGIINGAAWVDKGELIVGCTDSLAANYNSDANYDDRSCSGYPTNGKFDISFDGANDYIDINNVADEMVGATDWAFSAWVKPEKDAFRHTNVYYLAINCENGNANCNKILFGIRTEDGKPFIWEKPDGSESEGFVLTSETAINDGKWNHLVYSRTASTGTLYLNGVSIGTHTVKHVAFVASDKWSLGQEFDGVSLTNEYAGLIDDQAVWNDDLKPSEVTSIYAGGSNLDLNINSGNYASESNLIGYWKFDAGSDTIAYDHSGYANHAAINGATWVSVSDSLVTPGIDRYQSPISLSQSPPDIDSDDYTMNADGTLKKPIDWSFPSISGNGDIIEFIVRSDWHSKRPKDLQILYGKKVIASWVHPSKESGGCAESLDDYLQNGLSISASDCNTSTPSYSTGVLNSKVDFSEAENLKLRVLSTWEEHGIYFNGAWVRGGDHYEREGSVMYVSTIGSDLTGDGSMSNPFYSIQKGINLSKDKDTLLVVAGVYKENIDFTGKNISILGENRFRTIIDGDSSGTVVTIDSGEDSTAAFRGFTIRNGIAKMGGGIKVTNKSNPVISHLLVSHNRSHVDGGGIYINDSRASLSYVIIRENNSDGVAGGLYIGDGSEVTLNYSQFINNVAAVRGGGIFIRKHTTSLNLNHALISHNSSYEGGGIGSWHGSSNLNNITFIGNNSTTNRGNAIFLRQTAEMVLENSIVMGSDSNVIYLEDLESSFSATYSMIEKGWEGEGNIIADPLFCNLEIGNNISQLRNYSLWENSPCLGSGKDGANMGTFDIGCDVPKPFEWISSAVDTVNLTKSNLNEIYKLEWAKSNNQFGFVHYKVYASIGINSPYEEIHDTTATNLPITYQDFSDIPFGLFPTVSATTIKFSVVAIEGKDTVRVIGNDRVLYVNRYEYLSTSNEQIPTDFALYENYPNPFNPTTTIRFDLPIASDANLAIYNTLGQKVRTFQMNNISAGAHTIKWNATNDLGAPVSAGVYLYQLQTEGFIKTKKMILLK